MSDEVDNEEAGDRTQIAPTQPEDSRENTEEDDATVIGGYEAESLSPTVNDKTVIRNQALIHDETVIHDQSVPHERKVRLPEAEAAPEDTSMDATVVEAISQVSMGSLPAAPEAEAFTSKQVPKLIKDRFELVQKLGAGGMGAVYKAVDRRRAEMGDKNHFVAVKLLNNDFKHHPDAKVALQREFSKSQSLVHCQNIVQVFDFDMDDDLSFMVMEYLEGCDLADRLKDAGGVGLPQDEALSILKGICNGLSHAHKADLIHSDFKPANIYITKSGVAKVFDFGIVRATATAAAAKTEGEKSVFDPGALGAYTPNYASLEMLNGDVPDVRDDIYALAVVTYMLFSGEHPFKKQPANVAFEKKLKPKKLINLTKRQWRVLEKGLAFKREDRIKTVEEFYDGFTYKFKVNKIAAASVAIVVVAVGSLVMNYSTDEEKAEQIEKISSQVETDLTRDRLLSVLNSEPFKGDWEQRLYRDYQAAKNKLSLGDPWMVEQTQVIHNHYSSAVLKALTLNNIYQAKQYLNQIKQYPLEAPASVSAIDQSQTLLTDLSQKIDAALKAEEIKQEEERALAREQELKRIADQKKEQERLQKQAVNQQEFNSVFEELKQQLNCNMGINPKILSKSIKKLEKIDKKQFKPFHAQIQQVIQGCIEETAQISPEKARELKLGAILLYPNDKVLGAIQIPSPDTCYTSLAGKGGGARAGCKDTLSTGGVGPVLMVIPGFGGSASYAITKYEMSRGDYYQYCKATAKCDGLKAPNRPVQKLPQTNISIDQAKQYANWLTAETSFEYSLPDVSHWQHAAKANGDRIDPNRNCTLKIKGIKKGETLQSVAQGKANKWGLVNHVGNAQEWAVNSDGAMYVMGGAHTLPLAECKPDYKQRSNGAGDGVTSFRLIRKLR